MDILIQFLLLFKVLILKYFNFKICGSEGWQTFRKPPDITENIFTFGRVAPLCGKIFFWPGQKTRKSWKGWKPRKVVFHLSDVSERGVEGNTLKTNADR